MNTETIIPATFPSTTISSLSTAASSTITSAAKSKLGLSTFSLKTFRPSSPSPQPLVSQQPYSASKIIRDIYISDARTACSPAALSSLGITHVISVLGPSLRFRPKFPHWITSLDIPLEDSPYEDLLSAVRKATAWMEEILGGCEAKSKIGGKCRCFLQDDGDDDDGKNDGRLDGQSIGNVPSRPRILVHCWQGVSRSPSIVAAYFIKTHSSSSSQAYDTHIPSSITADEAIDFIRAKRPCVKPNQGFMRQLRQYEAIVKAECDMEDEWSTK